MSDTSSDKSGLFKAFALCASAYVLALCTAVFVAYATGERHLVLIAFVADIAATLVIFSFARMYSNASFYDAYWSLAPIAIALYWALGAAAESTLPERQAMVITLVAVWGIRLTWNWARGWRGMGHEDWRYADFRRRHGRRFWMVELGGIEMMPTLIVFLGCLSLYPALISADPLGALDWIALVVTAGAVLLEAASDNQLRNFLATAKAGQIMDRGLWKYCRHPNYLGEVAFWWGLYLFALAANPGYWWCVAGPIAMTLLFVFISIPMMDKRNLERRPGYAEHMKQVNAIIPWFKKK
jgi:steroid 5-alpha reductase family enzyme